MMCLSLHTSVLTLAILSAFTLTSMAKCSALQVPDGVRSKSVSVEQWTLLILNGRHLAYVAEGEGPPIYENGGRGCSSGNRLHQL